MDARARAASHAQATAAASVLLGGTAGERVVPRRDRSDGGVDGG